MATRTRRSWSNTRTPREAVPSFIPSRFSRRCCVRGKGRCPFGRRRACWSHPSRGTGWSIVDGERFDWAEFDTLAVPGGAWCEHHNASATEPVYLFVASDEPTLKKLSLYKSWGQTPEGDVVRLA